MTTPATHFEVTLTFEGQNYEQIVQMLGVPRVGDIVSCDHCLGYVACVIWNIGGLPFGRSVQVVIHPHPIRT